MIFQPHQRSQYTNRSGISTVLILLVVIAIVALAGLGYLYWQRQQDKLAQEKIQNQVTQLTQQVGAFVTPTPLVSPILTLPPGVTPGPDSQQPAAQVGTLQGKLSYPSEVMPKQKVCAVDTTTSVETCIEANGSTYALAVAPGTYDVYAVVTDNAPLKTKAYYSEFVTCGLQASCPSHKPIDVVVAAGATIQNVNPGDWYNQ